MADVTVAAVDLGASSGRVVMGTAGPNVLRIEAVARFGNEPLRLPDGLHWNVLELFQRALEGIANAAERASGPLTSVGVDSWAVDYALLSQGRLLGVPFHYRDEERAAGVDLVHARIPHADLYQRNGLQFLPFNTLYQLAADPSVPAADRLLLIPDLLTYWLTGQEVAERTNASTTGLLDVHTGEWDGYLIEALGLPRHVFGRLVDPGDIVGPVLPAMAQRLGVRDLSLTAVGSHDTASAVVGVPIQSDDVAYISCGTWGLVGLELGEPVVTESSRAANFTNEGGVDGRIRFLTNVMGLWLLSETLRQWDRGGESASLPRLLDAAAEVDAVPLFDVQDPRFLAPGDMPTRIASWFAEREVAGPGSQPAMVRCILESLARAFADAVDDAERLSGQVVRLIHIVGGGALNRLLCQLIADRSGRPVLAGPVEATALGNVLIQARTAGTVPGELEAMRGLIARTHDLETFQPRGRSARSAH